MCQLASLQIAAAESVQQELRKDIEQLKSDIARIGEEKVRNRLSDLGVPLCL